MKKRYKYIFVICWILLLAAGLGWKCYRDRGERGYFLVPRADHPLKEEVVYSQKDEEWGEDKLGDSRYTMGSSGCLTSCIAAALSAESRVTGKGQEIDPGELNRLFGEKGVYNSSGDIVWEQLEKALPDAEVIVAPFVDGDEVEELLDKGHYPIVKVRVGGNGAAHWVLIMGTWDKEYLCMDPLSESGRLISLKEHEHIAYRMRCVYWK